MDTEQMQAHLTLLGWVPVCRPQRLAHSVHHVLSGRIWQGVFHKQYGLVYVYMDEYRPQHVPLWGPPATHSDRERQLQYVWQVGDEAVAALYHFITNWEN